MKSRVLIGAGAWLLGVATATGGSMLAVDHLANGLLGTGTEQLSPASVHGALAGYQHSPDPSDVTRSASDDASKRPRRARARDVPAPKPRIVSSAPTVTASHSPASAGPGTLLTSQAGSVMADCQSGLAYLQYWSPDQGFQADDVIRGPAAQASVGFESNNREIVMRVSCQGSKPVAHIAGDS